MSDQVATFLLWHARLMDAPTAERIVHSLSVENYGYPQDPAMHRAVVAFRHLGATERLRAAELAMARLRALRRGATRVENQSLASLTPARRAAYVSEWTARLGPSGAPEDSNCDADTFFRISRGLLERTIRALESHPGEAESLLAADLRLLGERDCDLESTSKQLPLSGPGKDEEGAA